MENFLSEQENKHRMTLRVLPIPTKALATCIILALAVGMLGAMGQVVVHDIIPTFYSKGTSGEISISPVGPSDKPGDKPRLTTTTDRGDLFSEISPVKTQPKNKPFYKDELFIWTLKWTHIHLFGMSMIFLFMGGITLLLDVRSKVRTWLIVLPFIGVIIDILAVWLKGFVSQIFFWLHIPGGSVFSLIFGYVSLRALWEMWIRPVKAE